MNIFIFDCFVISEFQSFIRENFRNYIQGKGIIPYGIIVDVELFFIKPENGFWEKTEFFSELKQSAVNDEDYENSKYLYQTLKMRSLGDLNDLYNTQDIMFQAIPSQFQAMQNTYGFNPRKRNLLVP